MSLSCSPSLTHTVALSSADLWEPQQRNACWLCDGRRLVGRVQGQTEVTFDSVIVVERAWSHVNMSPLKLCVCVHQNLRKMEAESSEEPGRDLNELENADWVSFRAVMSLPMTNTQISTNHSSCPQIDLSQTRFPLFWLVVMAPVFVRVLVFLSVVIDSWSGWVGG